MEPNEVSGGDPIALGEAHPEHVKDNLITKPTKKVTQFSWCDSDDCVKIYVTQPEVLAIVADAIGNNIIIIINVSIGGQSY